MQTIEHEVGIMMLGFAIWLLARIIPGILALFYGRLPSFAL